MICQWDAFLSLVPPPFRPEVDKQGREEVRELRLRLGQPGQLVLGGGRRTLSPKTTGEDLQFVINNASRYSPWACATLSRGFLTGPGGHRIGICGQAVVSQGKITGFREPSSLCLRRAADFPGIAGDFGSLPGSVLIIGPPGAGKTTLLRDLIRERARDGRSNLAVVDERGELFPLNQGQWAYPLGPGTDVLTGCSKAEGIQILLRTMTPTTVAVDEISSEEDCAALIKAGWCGISLLATAHAGSPEDLRKRPIYRRLLAAGLFDRLIWLRGDGTKTVERMGSWGSN